MNLKFEMKLTNCGAHTKGKCYIYTTSPSSLMLMPKSPKLQLCLPNTFAGDFHRSNCPTVKPSSMAKGRKFTSGHRTERLLGTYAFNLHTHTAAGDSPEFSEHDVWSAVDEIDMNLSSSGDKPQRSSPEVSTSDRRRRNSGGLSLAFDDSRSGNSSLSAARIVHRGHDGGASPARGAQVASSAPVNVPDWGKILRCDSMESLRSMDAGFDEESETMVPPHEYLARSRKMAANSVFEGVGRTLKGRDMRRVRDAVWSQTGFDG